jgi:DNA primase
MLIPDSKIDEIRERLDIVSLVQRHGVTLKKTGRTFRGLCPFHSEKSPSFYVWAESKRFKCFGCQAGGDGIAFVQRLTGKAFLDTIRDLAQEMAIDLEAAVSPELKERAQIKEATDFAAQVFTQNLWHPTEGRAAREYLLSRGLTETSMRAFGLGLALSGWSQLADALKERGLLSHGEKAGLVTARAKADGYFDMFRSRLMIPIRSSEGRTIAFGGRLLGDAEGPKYLNSKESRLYQKSEVLYGTDVARDEIRKKKSAVLCEGYFDAIGLQQAGVKNAIALCSTALTAGHLQSLSRLEARELVLLLDGDDAGRNAIERLAGPILAAGAAARVAVLPQGEDPDTFARKQGPEAVQQLIASAPSLTSYLFTTLLPEAHEASFEAKMLALDRLKNVVSQFPLGLVRSAFFGALAKHTGLSATEIEVTFRVKSPPPIRPVPKGASGGEQFEAPPKKNECFYVAFLLRDKKLFALDTTRAADELEHAGLRTMVMRLIAGTSREEILFEMNSAIKSAIYQAREMLPKNEEDMEPAFRQTCLSLRLEAVKEEQRRINQQISSMPGSSHLTEETKVLMHMGNEVRALRSSLESSLAGLNLKQR